MALAAGLVSTPTQAASTAITVEGFEDTPTPWTNLLGSANVATTTDSVEGDQALNIGYDLRDGIVEVQRRTTDLEIPTATGLSHLDLKVRGDGSWNTLYVRLRDATGELLLYRVDALGWAGWESRTVDLRQPPAFHELGNNDGVLDYPLSVARLVVAPNVGTSTGSIGVDELVAHADGPTLPSASQRTFVPSVGERVTVSFDLPMAGDWSLRLTDGDGGPYEVSGTASAGPVSVPWDGRLADGTFARGNVRAVVSADATADGTLANAVTVANPYLTGALTRATAASPSMAPGVNSFISTITDPLEIDRQTALMEDAWLTLAREEFEWKRVEPANDRYDFAPFDRTVQNLRSRGIGVLGKLVYSAPWASSAPAGTDVAASVYYPPRSLEDWRDYVRSVATRYKGEVLAWEVWNEPNLAEFFRPSPDPVRYAAMLTAAYEEIKAVDPGAQVILGGLAGTDSPFLDGVRTAGAWEHFDGLGLHVYADGPPESGIMGQWLDEANAYLDQYGVARPRQVWVTEFGWSTCGGCAGGVSELEQASFLSRAFLDMSARSIRAATAYALVEDGDSATSLLDNYGLTERSGKRKQAWTAVSELAAALWQTVGMGRAQQGERVDLVSDLANSANWSTSLVQGDGWHRLAETDGRHGGEAGLVLDYSLGSATGVQLSTAARLSGTPSSVSLWVFGDGSANPLHLRIRDATGEYFQGSIGTASDRRWRRLTLWFDGHNPNWTVWGGDKDRVVDYPVTVDAVFIYRGSLERHSGQVFIDDLQTGYGAPLRGAVLLGRTWSIQALYRLDAGTSLVQLPVADVEAFAQYGNGYHPLDVANRVASVGLHDSPTYVASHLGSHGDIFTPDADGADDAATLFWTSGDQSRVYLQVLRAAGEHLVTLSSDERFSAGRHQFLWDGRYLDGGAWLAAPPGRYRLRLTGIGDDGQHSIAERSYFIP